MKVAALMFWFVLGVAATAAAQIEWIGSYFPADFEFPELQQATLQETFEDSARLSKIDGGRLFGDVGFEKYERRVYPAGNSGSVSAEVLTLKDARAAYALLTLLRNSDIQVGPPGDAYTATAEGIRFAQGREWVRIQGHHTSEDLLKRVANSISHRMGPVRQKAPSLISHLPKLGYEASSVRYFPGLKSYESYSGTGADPYLKFNSDMEIVQAHYSLDNCKGTLSLLSFLTPQVADEYFADLPGPQLASQRAGEVYVKRAGPIVAVLEGTFDPASANKLLSLIKFSYSIRWIYDKGHKSTTIWGVPAGILGTVVKSLLFVVLLCAFSIVAGVGFAVFRVVLRGYAPKNLLDRPERTEITRLRLR